MEPAFEPEAWHDLFVVIGTSAGALVGLLFIVMSLHIDRISKRSDHNARATMEGARNNTLHLLTVLVEASLVLTPQPLTWLGVELIAVNVFGLRLPFTVLYRYYDKRLTISEKGGFPMGLFVTIIIAYLLGITGGVAVLTRPDLGLYLVAASCLTKLVRSVLTAWMMLMFGVGHPQPEKQGS